MRLNYATFALAVILAMFVSAQAETQITSHANGFIFAEGERVTLTGQGNNLSWSYDADSDGKGEVSIGTGATVDFSVPTDVSGPKSIVIFLRGSEGSDEISGNIGAAASNGITGRGRVRLSETTIVSDWGTPLRGCFWSLDFNNGQMCSRDAIANIKDLGLNALHLWAECYKNPTGSNIDETETIVQWCAEEGLYCVICYGACDMNTHYYYDKVTAFWKLYAGRLKNWTNVVFEIANEPQYLSCAYADSAIDMNRDCYNIIRERAPDTHVLFFTYCNIYGGAEPPIRDVGRLGDGIDWSNASVAFHGYLAQQGEPSPGTQRQAIYDCAAAGVRMTCTEFPRELEENIPVYEETQISYFHFLSVNNISGFIHDVVNSGIRWHPDYGDWPLAQVDRVAYASTPAACVSPPKDVASSNLPQLIIRSPRLPARGSFAVYDLQGRLIRGSRLQRAGNGMAIVRPLHHIP
ncbi:MAG: cellulase family glycosylhydrolase [Chitinivibrionales bacterium]|nr:cellulase family glycosylhydrolase [Chitinivibrionales bacterium]MBD3395502.1 cellulase family glycosylhydrolase [Chitinivibrionales bacterium]